MGSKTEIAILMLFAVVLVQLTAFAATSGPTPIPPAPNFQVTTQALALCKGITNNIPVTVTNQGNSDNPQMQDVQLGLSNRNLVQIGNAVEINTITPHNSSIVNIQAFVDLNASSLMTVQVPINYNYLTLYSDSESRNLTFQVQSCPSEMPLVVNVSPSILVSGQINNITYSFTNTGNTTLQDISASASIRGSQTGVVFIGRQPIQIESLEPYSTVNVVEGMYENNSQIFPLNVTTDFFNGTQLDELSDSFAMISGGTTVMVPSSIATSPTNVTPGSIFSVSFIITDIGTSGVTNAEATATPPKGFREYGSSGLASFIGSIGTQSPTAISLTLIANSSIKDGSYKIPVTISYLNSLRQNLSTTVNVPVVIGGTGLSGNFVGTGAFTGNATGAEKFVRERGASSYLIYIEIGLGIAIIAVAALSVLLVKERKRNRTPK